MEQRTSFSSAGEVSALQTNKVLRNWQPTRLFATLICCWQ